MAPSATCNDPQPVRLPNLRTKPSYQQLLNSLEGLAIKPASWGGISTAADADKIDSKASHKFLVDVIKSDLLWIEGDAGDDVTKREFLLEVASKRLTERCGRAAMPEMTRTWIIDPSECHPELKIDIREPPLTGDNIGLKTWGTAFTIAKKIEDIGSQHFGHLVTGPNDKFTTSGGTSFTRKEIRILELGSGTGLVGIAAASVLGCDVVLTDLPDIVPNLSFNILQNAKLIAVLEGTASCVALDWKNPAGAFAPDCNKFDIVLAVDPLYDDEHPKLVAEMFKNHLRYSRSSRGLIAIPMRDKTTQNMCTDFVEKSRRHGLQLIFQGEEQVRDDWETVDGEEVKCWWGLWGWSLPYNRSTPSFQ